MDKLAESEQKIVLVIWEDCRQLIAALKVQRWDVTKWSVTINIALAGAAATIGQSNKWWLFLFAIIVSVIGCALVFHYNSRITKVRDRLKLVTDFVRESIFDFNTRLGLTIGARKGPDYDREELRAFYGAITLSLIPSVIAVLAS